MKRQKTSRLPEKDVSCCSSIETSQQEKRIRIGLANLWNLDLDEARTMFATRFQNAGENLWYRGVIAKFTPNSTNPRDILLNAESVRSKMEQELDYTEWDVIRLYCGGFIKETSKFKRIDL